MRMDFFSGVSNPSTLVYVVSTIEDPFVRLFYIIVIFKIFFVNRLST